MNETEGGQTRLSKKNSLSRVPHFERPGFDGYWLVRPEDGFGFTSLVISVHGSHPRKKITSGTRSYFVTDGEGIFTLDGKRTKAKQGDQYVIPEGGEYSYQGDMTLHEVNVPATTSDIKLEKKK